MAVDIRLEKRIGDFSLDARICTDSRRIGILGASGCGKSMTLKCIAGIETPDAGQIIMDGRVLYGAQVNVRPQQRKIGYLFQNYALFPTMTVEDNIGAGLKGKREEKAERVGRMMEKFRLDGLKKRLPGELSGGQQQRVALARIMAYEPDVILLDEPFSALDEFLRDRLQQEMLTMLEDYPGTVILVSHSRDEIYRFSEELVVMDEGKTICQGKTKKIFAKPEHEAAARLTGCKNIKRAERRDAHHLFLPDWGITFTMRQEVPEAIRCVGIRAHEFQPVWKCDDVCAEESWIPVRLESEARLPFERKYFLQEPYGNGNICWFVQREQWRELEKRGLPDYLKISEENLLLLI